jgi:hypothetical protein
MNPLQLIEVLALALLFLALMGRAVLLGRAKGWPSAPWVVRTALAMMASAAAARASQVLLRHAPVDPSEVGLIAILALGAAVLAANVIAQRAPHDRNPGFGRTHLAGASGDRHRPAH